MPGPKLRSASANQYAALGERGQQLYALAPQILETLRHALPSLVSYFAVPRPSDDGRSIEWYAPQPGTVIPWSSTTPLEQELARGRLVGVRDEILRLQESVQGAEHDDEARLCLDMLTWVFYHPDDSHRFLVNGQPVLTFWGFTKKGASLDRDPLGFSIIYYPEQGEPRVDRIARVVRRDDPVEEPWWQRWRLSLLVILLVLALFFVLPILPIWPDPGQSADESNPAPKENTALCKQQWGWCATRGWPKS